MIIIESKRKKPATILKKTIVCHRDRGTQKGRFRCALKSLTQKAYDETKNDMMFNQLGGFYDSLRQKENRRRDLMNDNDIALNELKETHELLAQLNNLKKRIGGE